MREMFKMSLYFLVLLELSVTHALQCYNCSGVSDVEECSTATDCRAGQSCYMDKSASGQTSTLGCADNQRCGAYASGASLVGRELTSRQQIACFECCSKDDCNKNLCIHLKPKACIDDAKADCAWMNTMFNICTDIQHAKTVCPRFCSLCSLVDGDWAEWTSWSGCDVTCANGTRTRTRTCTNPSPANGGIDCAGSSTDTQTCLKELCPVHGGWTKWGPWDDCSVTCGTGLQKRHRNCSNPAPSLFGDHCYGDTLDVRTCSPAPCAPKNVAFLAHTVTDITPSAGQTMIFGTVIENAGHAYSTSTGVFTAPVNGTYSFSTQFCVYGSKELYVAIVVDGVTYATDYIYDMTGYSCDSTSTVAVLHANAKVWVKCTSASVSGTIIRQNVANYMNSFSGYLIHQ